jgi:hypothetical protein
MQIFKTYETGRVVVPDGLGVAEGLHHRIGLHNLRRGQQAQKSRNLHNLVSTHILLAIEQVPKF